MMAAYELAKLRTTSRATGTVEMIRRCHVAAARITDLEAKLREIITDATSLNHAMTIARDGLHGDKQP